MTTHEVIQQMQAMLLTDAELVSLRDRQRGRDTRAAQRIIEAAEWLLAMRRIDAGAK